MDMTLTMYIDNDERLLQKLIRIKGNKSFNDTIFAGYVVADNVAYNVI